MAPQTAISKAVCYKTKNEQFWEKAVHFLLVATNCFYAGLPTVFCTITSFYGYTCYTFRLNGKFGSRAKPRVFTSPHKVQCLSIDFSKSEQIF